MKGNVERHDSEYLENCMEGEGKDKSARTPGWVTGLWRTWIPEIQE
jgi:hypothetical protein